MKHKLKQKALDWRDQLKACQFVGEIVISTEELKPLASSLYKHLQDLSKDEKHVILPIIAVNCAYYYYDDEGFWVHFCKILGVPLDAGSQQFFGASIEDALISQKFIMKRREGAFRYVGPILEQSGITRRYMEKFANILYKGSEKHGWDGLRTIDYNSYKALIEHHEASVYLKNFLLDESGYSFFKAVSRNIGQYQHKYLEIKELQNLMGYRPGFWKDLLDKLPVQLVGGAAPANRRTAPLPRIIFDPDYLRVSWQFDREYAAKACYKINGQLIAGTMRVFSGPEDFSEHHEVHLKNDDGSWKRVDIKGWDPARARFAFFEEVKGYISDLTKIAPGGYFILAPITETVPSDIITGDLGIADLPFDQQYNVFSAQINNSDDLSFMGVEIQVSNNDFLSWADMDNVFTDARDICEVFLGKLPQLRVKQAGLFRSNLLALFFDSGKGRERIHVMGDSDEILLALNPHLPAKGQVWIEPIGRLSRFADVDIIDSLSFCVIPTCSISKPTNLLSAADVAEIRVEAEENTKVEFHDCVAMDAAGRLWRPSPELRVIEGSLRVENISLSLAIRLFRARLYMIGDNLPKRIRKDELSHRAGLLAEGLPGREAKIAVTGVNTYQLGSVGRFDSRGNCRFSTTDIRDRIARVTEIVGRFGIIAENGLVLTNTYFYDTDRMKASLVDEEEGQVNKWIAYCEDNIQGPLSMLLNIIRGNIAVISTDIIKPLAELMGKWTVEIIACSLAFDETRGVYSLHKLRELLEENVNEGLAWYIRARDVYGVGNESIASGSTDDLLNQYARLKWRPPLDKWIKVFEETAERLKADNELAPLIEEWAKEVPEAPYLYGSRISELPYGDKLTLAWHFYYIGRFARAYQQADIVIKNASSPIRDLGVIVACLSLLKTGRFEQVGSIEVLNPHRRLAGHISTLSHAAHLLIANEKPERMSSLSQALDSLKLPLRVEDHLLLGRKFVRTEINKNYEQNCEAWLFLLIGLCDAMHNKDIANISVISNILRTCYNMPESPLIRDILERAKKVTA